MKLQKGVPYELECQVFGRFQDDNNDDGTFNFLWMPNRKVSMHEITQKVASAY